MIKNNSLQRNPLLIDIEKEDEFFLDINSQIAQYQLLEKLGEGGMGIVYKAWDLELNRAVALKFISESQKDKYPRHRFYQEVQSLAKLNHPNIVRILSVSKESQLYFAMEYIDGPTIDKWSHQNNYHKIAQVFCDIAKAIHFFHSHKIIHRDIKPSNILISKSTPMIIDFGLSKRKDSSFCSASDHIVGTLTYMSPEQIQNKKLDHRTDIYSIGSTLYYILTNCLVFEEDIIKSICQREPVKPSTICSQIPKDLEAICLKCLEKNPYSRYQTSLDLANDLENFTLYRPIQASLPTKFSRVKKVIYRNKTLSAVFSFLFIVLYSFLMFYIHSIHERQQDAIMAREKSQIQLEKANVRIAKISLAKAKKAEKERKWRECLALIATALELVKDFQGREARKIHRDSMSWIQKIIKIQPVLWRKANNSVLAEKDDLTFVNLSTDNSTSYLFTDEGGKHRKFTKDGRFVFISANQELCVYDPIKNNVQQKIKIPKSKSSVFVINTEGSIEVLYNDANKKSHVIMDIEGNVRQIINSEDSWDRWWSNYALSKDYFVKQSDNQIHIINRKNKSVKVIKRFKYAFAGLTISHGNLFSFVGKFIYVWKLSTQKLISKIKIDHHWNIRLPQIIPENNNSVWIRDKKGMFLWNFTTNEKEYTSYHIPNNLLFLAKHPNKKNFIFASKAKEKIENWQLSFTYKIFKSNIPWYFNEIFMGENHFVILRKRIDRDRINKLQDDIGFDAVEFSGDGYVDYDNSQIFFEIEVYDKRNSQFLWKKEVTEFVKFTQSGDIMIRVLESFITLDIESGKTKTKLSHKKLYDRKHFFGDTFSKDLSIIAYSAYDSEHKRTKINIVNTSNYNLLHSIPLKEWGEYYIVGNHFLIHETKTDHLEIWNIHSGKRQLFISNFQTPKGSLFAFTSNNNYAILSNREMFQVWNLKKQTLKYSFSTNVDSLAIHPNNQMFVVGDKGSISLWDLETNQLLCYLLDKKNIHYIHKLFFNKSGNELSFVFIEKKGGAKQLAVLDLSSLNLKSRHGIREDISNKELKKKLKNSPKQIIEFLFAKTVNEQLDVENKNDSAHKNK
ncbi:protein kinase [Candidatus Uabimicrobium sp. HlEnr_7]|uniref:serine/threonine-protein kinase n=1 Tax=Candidatus Uabimicrobium helgolandensis TaxID=3095367 RepID=UPI003555FE2F